MQKTLLVLFLASLVACQGDVGEEARMKPWFQVVPDIVPADVCRRIIEAAERAGIPLEVDSIDFGEPTNAASQALDVFDRGEVMNQEIWDLMEPYVPRMAQLVQDRKDAVWDAEKARESFPTAGWIFLRKYSPSSARNNLKVHHDINVHTVNVALNDAYTGGGFFVVHPEQVPADFNYSNVPDVPYSWQSYEFLRAMKRKNTSAVTFPEMPTGSVIVYNNTVWHGVAPLEGGVRYSLAYFFDTPPPTEEVTVSFTFASEPPEGDHVDFYWYNSGNYKYNLQAESLQKGQVIEQTTFPGHKFVTKLRSTNQILQDFIVPDESQSFVELRYDPKDDL